MQDYPEKYHSKWGAVHAQNIPDVSIALQELHETKGSCCQNGDVEVAPCPGWWYQCPNYGIRDFKTWLKFGPTGLTMPPVTEHKATCQYFPERTQCPLPSTCNARFPTRSLPHTPLTERDVCKEIIDTRYLGFDTLPKPVVKPPPQVLKVTQQQLQQMGRPKTQPRSPVMDDMVRPGPKKMDPAFAGTYTNPFRTEAASQLHAERVNHADNIQKQQQPVTTVVKKVDSVASFARTYSNPLRSEDVGSAKRPHLEAVAQVPRLPVARPDRTNPQSTATAAVHDMSDLGPFDSENLQSIGENDQIVIRTNYQASGVGNDQNDSIQMRKRKNRLRRRNRRIDTVTITANNKNNQQIGGAGVGSSRPAAGLRVRMMDDIQLA